MGHNFKPIGLVKLHWLANEILATHSSGWANCLTFYLFASKSLIFTIEIALNYLEKYQT